MEDITEFYSKAKKLVQYMSTKEDKKAKESSVEIQSESKVKRMSSPPRYRICMCMSTKSNLIVMGVVCALFAYISLSSSSWRIYSAFKDLASPVNKTYENDVTRVMLKILWYNRPSWFGKEEDECNKLIRSCFHNNCVISHNISLLEEVDAVIFDATESSFPANPPLVLHKGRIPNQIWIFFGLESPIHYYYTHFKKPAWRSMFNWTMTYRLDSDIPIPYGMLFNNSHPPDRNYTAIVQSKKQFAAWIVSHCKANSKRDEYVRLLQKYVPVDIFGNCGTKSCSRKGTECRDGIGKDYKFYLGFENSLCKDYITEKFFQYFSLDLITIWRGYSENKYLLPSDTYINTANFSTVQELALFLKNLAEDEDKYVLYLKSKDRYVSKKPKWSYCNGLCNICEKLNNLEKYKRSYNDIVIWLENKTCSLASDIR